MAEKQHLSEHPGASSSQDYLYPPLSSYAPPPALPFHQAYPPTNVIPGSFPAPVVQQHTNAQHHGYHQDRQLSSTKRNADALDRIATRVYKKQALSTNSYANSATSSSIPQDHLQEVPGHSRPYPPSSQITPIERPNLVIGSAIATESSSNRRNDGHRIVSKISSVSPSSSMQISSKELHSTTRKSNQHDAIRSRTNVLQKQNTRQTSTPTDNEARGETKTSNSPLLRSLGQPSHGLRYKQFGKKQADICVVASRIIDQGHVFQLVQGDVKMLDCLHNTQAWELCFYGSVAAYVVPKPKEWMGYIRNARFPEECNLEADQVYGRIHFTVIRRIEPGSELRVFYSDLYRENCGFMYDLAALNYDKGMDDFACTMCNMRVNNSKSMVRHCKFTHPNGSSKVPSDKVQKRMHPRDGLHTLELESSEGSGESLGDNGENEEGSESGGSFGDGSEWLEEDRGDQSPHGGGSSELLICMTCGKNFNSQSQLLMHESFHEAEEEKEDGLDEEGEEDEELDDDVDDLVDEQGDDSDEEEEVENMEEKGENPLCSICGFAFDEDKLAGHKAKHRTHSFPCNECGKLYLRRKGIYRHKKEVHGAAAIRQRRNVNVFLQDFTASNTPQLRSAVTVAPGDPENEVPLKRNQCKVCNFIASSSSDLRFHLSKHKNKPFGCEQCGVAFLERNYMYKHLRRKHGALREQKYFAPHRTASIMKYLSGRAMLENTCKDCGYSCLSIDEFNEHEFKHRNAPFGCKECGRVFIHEEALSSHTCRCMENEVGASDDAMEKDKSNPGITPPSSSSTIASFNNLEVNRDLCLHCGYYTPHKSVLAEHLEQHKTYPNGCIDCGNTYAGLNTLYRHKREKHNGGYLKTRRQKDSIRTLDLPDNLKIIGDMCARCGFKSSDKGFLSDHAILHLTHPFGCIDCGNVYTSLKTMGRHKQAKHPTVSENKMVNTIKDPNTCQKCGFTCHNKSILEEHRRKHKIAEYGCDICGEVFPEDKFVILHKREKHCDLLEGLQDEALDVGDEEDGDYLGSGFIKISVEDVGE